jgi:hypothetical protein
MSKTTQTFHRWIRLAGLTMFACATLVTPLAAAGLTTADGSTLEGTIRCTTSTRVFIETKNRHMEIAKKSDLSDEGRSYVAGWEEANADWALLPVKFDRMPDLQYRVQPDRSRVDNAANQVVMIALLLNEDGTVQGAYVRDSTDGRLNEPTIEALSRWKFSPAEIGSRPSRSVLSVPVQF